MTLSFNVTLPTQILPIAVVTLGIQGKDFSQQSTGTTCGVVTTGMTCTIAVTFAPASPGLQRGAVILRDTNDNVLATVPVYGTGLAPQAAFYGSAPTVTGGTGLNLPAAVAADRAGNLFIADTFNNRVVEIPVDGGAQTTVGTGLTSPSGVAIDGAGDIVVSELGRGNLILIPPAGSGPQVTLGSGFNHPGGVAVDGSGYIYIADSQNNQVIRLNADGSSPRSLTSQVNELINPTAVAVDALGDVFVADTGRNDIFKLFPDGRGEYIGPFNEPQGIAVDAAGDIFISETGTNQVVELPAGGGQSFTVASGLNSPLGLTFDLAGNLYVADSNNNRVVELPATPPASLQFDTTQVGSTSNDSPQIILVQNIGNQQLDVTDVVYPVDFPISLVASGYYDLCTGETNLSPGQFCDLWFNFTPLGLTPQPEQFTMTDNSMNVASAKQSIALSGTAKLTQNVIFVPPPVLTFGVPKLNLDNYAGATSGLQVTFKLVSGPAQLSVSSLVFTGSGTVVLQANQAGSASYFAAAPVTETIIVLKSVPVLTWTAPESIVYGTKLGAEQLGAHANVPGKFIYTPAAGTVLAAGSQTLSATFMPTNNAGYSSVTAKVKIVVAKATLTVSAKNVNVKHGSPIPKFTPIYAGFVNGDIAAKALSGAPALSTTAKSTSPAGSYSISVNQGTLAAKNYVFKLVNGMLTITK